MRYLPTLVIPACLMTTAPAWAGEESSSSDLSEIVVVAKRAQTSESVAGGLSILEGERLDSHQVSRSDDLQKLLPGLTINARGNRAYSNITVRGISSPDFFSPAVQIYIDGAPQTPAAFTQPLLDVERVEFLRGPQGTIYGANAMGGVINIITRQPRENRAYVEGRLSTLSGGGEAGGTLAVAEDVLYLDAALYGHRGFGRIDDISTGRRNVDKSDTLAGRLALRYAPEGGPFDARISFSRERMRSHEELYLIDGHAAALEYESAVYGPIPYLRRDLTSASALLNWRVGSGFQLTSITSWQDNDLKRDFPGRVPGFLFRWPQREKVLTQEVRLARGGQGTLSGVVGFWYQDSDFTSWKNGFPGFYGDSVNRVDSESIAAFADITVRPAVGLDLSVGARVSRDKSTIDATRADSYGTGFGFAFRRSSSYDGFQPKISASYEVVEGLRLYGVIARGYKPGGYNHSISSLADAQPYDPEKAINYEVGAKANGLLGGSLDLALSAYLIRSTDKQIYVGILGQQIIRNAGKASSRGVELELAWRPSVRLNVTGNLSAGRSRFTDFVDAAARISYTGNQIPYAPDITGRLFARYAIPQPWLAGELSVQGGITYNSRTYFDEANIASQDPAATIDLSFQAKFENGTTIRLFANNLTDRIIRTSGYVFDRSYWTVDTGRSVGIALRQDF